MAAVYARGLEEPVLLQSPLTLQGRTWLQCEAWTPLAAIMSIVVRGVAAGFLVELDGRS